MSAEPTIHWGEIDRTPEPGAYVRYLDAVSDCSHFRAVKRSTYERLGIAEGHRVLDIGCGTGDDVRALARRVGTSGRVVGIDRSSAMVEEARRRASGQELPVEFVVGDCGSLPFEAGVFDGCRLDRVLVHLDDPFGTLEEVVRVLRPGGTVVVFDVDWETAVVDAANRDVTRRILNSLCDLGSPSPWIGRRLHGLLAGVGLVDTETVASTASFTDFALANAILTLEEAASRAADAGLVTDEDARGWIDELQRSDAASRFFAALTGFCVSGRKPKAPTSSPASPLRVGFPRSMPTEEPPSTGDGGANDGSRPRADGHPSPVTYADVLEAVPRVRRELRPTPLLEWPGLSELVGARVLVKHENHQPFGAFKVRGGVNLVSRLTDDERRAGVLACSTGNHGLSLAYACRRFGVACTVVVPEGNNPSKNAAIRRLGATLVEHGRDFDEAKGFLECELVPRGGRYVHAANEPHLIAGVGTMAVEVLDNLPNPDVILAPIGFGSCVSGSAVVVKHLRPETEIIGVQAEGAPAGVLSWRAGELTTTERADTWAEGVATRSAAEMTQSIMRELMDDALLVTDEEIRRACRWYLEHAHTLAEGAGAATLAAAYRYRDRFAGRTIVCVLSGGNLDPTELPRILVCGDTP